MKYISHQICHYLRSYKISFNLQFFFPNSIFYSNNSHSQNHHHHLYTIFTKVYKLEDDIFFSQYFTNVQDNFLRYKPKRKLPFYVILIQWNHNVPTKLIYDIGNIPIKYISPLIETNTPDAEVQGLFHKNFAGRAEGSGPA